MFTKFSEIFEELRSRGTRKRMVAAWGVDSHTIAAASKAVELILAESDEKAMELACELCDINRERQGEENRIAELAYKKIEETRKILLRVTL